MFRLLGFLVGSAMAIAIILLIIGVPDFHMAESGIDRQRFDAAVEKLREKQQAAAQIAEVIVNDVVTAVASAQGNLETVPEKALPQLPLFQDTHELMQQQLPIQDTHEPQLPLIQDPHELMQQQLPFQDTHESNQQQPPIQDTHVPPAPDDPATDGGYALSIEELQWYSFWNPFRSQFAASGFVSQLEKVTGLDYRVVKVKAGVYEVAFAYSDDMERRHKLSRISAATGLDLPDS